MSATAIAATDSWFFCAEGALSVNAVQDFFSRIRENSGVIGVAPKSLDFGYVIGPPFFPLPNPLRRCLSVAL